MQSDDTSLEYHVALTPAEQVMADHATAVTLQSAIDVVDTMQTAMEAERLTRETLEYQARCDHSYKGRVDFYTDNCVYCRKTFDMRHVPLMKRAEESEILMATAIGEWLQRHKTLRNTNTEWLSMLLIPYLSAYDSYGDPSSVRADALARGVPKFVAAQIQAPKHNWMKLLRQEVREGKATLPFSFFRDPLVRKWWLLETTNQLSCDRIPHMNCYNPYYQRCFWRQYMQERAAKREAQDPAPYLERLIQVKPKFVGKMRKAATWEEFTRPKVWTLDTLWQRMSSDSNIGYYWDAQRQGVKFHTAPESGTRWRLRNFCQRSDEMPKAKEELIDAFAKGTYREDIKAYSLTLELRGRATDLAECYYYNYNTVWVQPPPEWATSIRLAKSRIKLNELEYKIAIETLFGDRKEKEQPKAIKPPPPPPVQREAKAPSADEEDEITKLTKAAQAKAAESKKAAPAKKGAQSSRLLAQPSLVEKRVKGKPAKGKPAKGKKGK